MARTAATSNDGEYVYSTLPCRSSYESGHVCMDRLGCLVVQGRESWGSGEMEQPVGPVYIARAS